MSAIRSVAEALSPTRRARIGLTMAAMVVGAIAEAAAIGSIVPFLARLGGDPGTSAGFLVLPLRALSPVMLGALFIGLTVIAGALRLLVARASQSLAFAIADDLSLSVLGRLLRTDYAFHVRRHSGETIALFQKIQNLAFSVFLSAMQAIVSMLTALLIIGLLVAISPLLALVGGAALIVFYLVISALVRAPLERYGTIASDNLSRRIRIVQDALGGIRDILLSRSHRVYEDAFRSASAATRRAMVANSFLWTAPRILVETAGVVFVGLFLWAISGRPGGVAAALPVLAALGLGAQRLLPHIHSAFVGWSSVIANKAVIAEVAAGLTVPIRARDEADGSRARWTTVALERVGFAYPGRAPLFDGIDLSIRRGDRIGIYGPTGAGKSTLGDLLMGLLAPTSGTIRIDGEALASAGIAAWQAQVAHVPQQLYLADDSVAANIAFGVPRSAIDRARVLDAASLAGLENVVAALPAGLDTMVGERGVLLSGGQRQRIGLARALYRAPALLVLDEATSALDPATERSVLESINRLDKDMTVIIIAHRQSTLDHCPRRFEVADGQVVEPCADAARQPVTD